MMGTPLCIQMVGLPGSGKTSLRKFVCENYDLKIYQVMVLSLDDYIIDNLDGRPYAEGFADLIEEATAVYTTRALRAAAGGLNILIDKTNLTRRQRALNHTCFSHHMHVAVEVVKHRKQRLADLAARTSHTLPDDVLERLEKSYQPVDLTQEGFFYSVSRFTADPVH